MNNWFTWNGTSCLTYGIEVLKQPEIVIAQERQTAEKVAGRSGSVTLLEGDWVYDDITLSCDCRIRSLTGLEAAMAWLQGAGTLTFAGRPGGYYVGRLSQQINLSKILAVRDDRRFTLVWRCEPWFYLTPGSNIELTSAGTVTNAGTVPSEPRITVYGSGDVTLSVGGIVIGLSDLEDGIILDSALMDALSLDESELMNGHMSGEFPILGVGSTAISWASDTIQDGGSVTKVVIEPRWRGF